MPNSHLWEFVYLTGTFWGCHWGRDTIAKNSGRPTLTLRAGS